MTIPELNKRIAEIEGLDNIRMTETNCLIRETTAGGSIRMNGVIYSPCTDWSQGGPLIEKYKISVNPVYSSDPDQQWCAVKGGIHYGATLLIAVMKSIINTRGT